MKNLNTANNTNQEALVLTVTQDAYPQADYRFGFDNPIAGWTATAVDQEGNHYTVWWKEKEKGTWDETDTGQACNWEKPDKVTDTYGYWVDPDTVVIK